MLREAPARVKVREGYHIQGFQHTLVYIIIIMGQIWITVSPRGKNPTPVLLITLIEEQFQPRSEIRRAVMTSAPLAVRKALTYNRR